MIDKKTFRNNQLTKLKNSDNVDSQEEQKILDNLFSTFEWQEAHSIATVISGPIEFPTKNLIKQAQIEGKQVYLPKVMPKRQMAFLPFIGYDQLVKSNFGLLEPAYDETLVNQQIDLIIVPGLAFALDSNNRLSFGGGYYDRFLSHYLGRTVSLVPPMMSFTTNKWPIEDHDIKINTLVTDNEIIRI
ncbi:5-formyltetrahydrofolate cyclo-ligase [Lentilactobacillus senioris DSM 24302 = JCM 17472]|uniref:5-formyltetrahydrofolate cyclo-ligase n=1 Tax=Lentilactobacillus senioris DSM 24302 = JCM 17472 TaxID=1423802 RepID=A0A0R2CUF1_9LACO|nr:5-formyltetrahydrofolate cyclo-ligase [Lentilactobacillus senioris]KRM93284.1 5-formyltetrahydrofolate cyclo-ligase [Lentilactobacillus senioris DSM 24302 = JCM 17472]MCY9806431.1 5-formyltetrahydrofolate cyclo-ligase [Lentilactobacillus senioris]